MNTRTGVLASILIAVTTSVSASPITWSGPTRFTDTNQLISNEDGVTLLEAYNPGGTADIAVGGTVFAAGGGSLVDAPLVYAAASVAGSPTTNDAMNTILNSFLYAGEGRPALRLTKLVVGRKYKVQMFIVDNRNIEKVPTYQAAVDRANGGVKGWDIGDGVPGHASFITGSFAASTNAVSIPIELSINDAPYGANGACLNAYLLVEVGTAPAAEKAMVPQAAAYSHGANPGVDVAYYPSQLLSAHPKRNGSAREIGHPWVDGMHQPALDHFCVDSGSGVLRVISGHRCENELTFRQSGVLCPPSPAFSFRFGIRGKLATLLPGVALDGRISWLRDWPVDDYQIHPARVVYLLHSPSGQLKARLEVVQAVSTGGAGIIAKLDLKNASAAKLKPRLILAGYSGLSAVLPETLPCDGAGLLQIACTYVEPKHASHGLALDNLHQTDYVLLAGFDGGASQKNLDLEPNTSAGTCFMALLDAPDQPDPEIVRRVNEYFDRNQAIVPKVRRSLADATLNAYVYCTTRGDKKMAQHKSRLAEVFAASSAACSNGIYRGSPCRIDLPDKKLSSYLNYAANDLLPALVQPAGLVHDSKYYGVWHYIFAYRHQHAAMNLGLEKEAINDLLLRSCNQKADGFLRGIHADFKTDDHPTMYEESYIDAVHHYWKWTGDFEPVRQLWPTMVKAVQFMERVLNADGDDLYSDLLHQYKSDSDSRGPSSVFQSAMVWRAYAAMAEFAEKMTLTDAPAYRTKAERIRAAIQRELWSPEKVIIGSKGPLGMLRLHPECLEVEIPVRTGAVDPYQAYVITDWYLRNGTFKDADKNVWVLGGDWWPRVWSQGLNMPSDSIMIGMTALLSGCFDAGTQILSSYAGPAYKATRFGDGYVLDSDQHPQWCGCGVAAATCQGAWGRALVEGLFGVDPHLDEDYITVRPNLPRSWKRASFERPGLSVSFAESDLRCRWKVTTASNVAARLELPVFAPVKSLQVNGQAASVAIRPGMACGRLTLNTPPGGAELCLELQPAGYTIRAVTTNAVRQNGKCDVAYSGLDEIAADDRFGFFSDIRLQDGRIAMKLAKTGCGRATLFLNCRSGSLRWIQPVSFDTDNPVRYVQTVTDPLPPGSKLIPVDLGGAYNENINTCFNHRWEWDHGKFFPYPELISTDKIRYWYYEPFVLAEPLPVRLRVGQIPFRVGTKGTLTEKNLAMIANTPPRELPTGLTIQIGRKVNKIYLLSLNYVLAQKSYVPCVQIALHYADGNVEKRELVNPYNFDFFGQNSGINTLEYALNPVPRHNQVYYKDTHLTMTDVRCDSSRPLAEITFKSIATETFFALAGMTLNVPLEK